MLSSDEVAVLELLAIKPPSYLPPHPYGIVRRLADRGLATFRDGQWYPTVAGLNVSGRVVH